MTFEQWYKDHKLMVESIGSRKEVAFYVWNNKPKAAKRSAKTPDGYSQDFETFWKEYPNKTAKHVAYISWNKVKPPIIDIMSALEWQTKQENWTKDNGKFVPHAATYLNQRRWLDEKPAGMNKGEAYMDMNGCIRYR